MLRQGKRTIARFFVGPLLGKTNTKAGVLTTIELHGGPGAASQARRAIEQLADQEQLPRVEDLRLLVSELVTNCVIHGGAGPGDRVTLSVEQPQDLIRVEVRDRGRGWTKRTRSREIDSDEPPGGWGLMLVGELADRWGINSEKGTCVWFEMAARREAAVVPLSA
jgi:anti-sigma regulatory factor (Ser/Thr protein kinase)